MLRGLLLITLCFSTVAAGGNDALSIDPLLLREVDTVWPVIAGAGNPLWPGWDAGLSPMMIYLPGEEELLIDHPDPPADFVPYHGPLALEGRTMMVRRGPTTIEFDGQNTSTSIFGEETLVLADTLSNRKQWLRGWEYDETPAEEKLSGLDYASLRADPYEQMAMIAHEAFHVYQFREMPHRAADERAVRVYPCLSVRNNVGMALEGDALLECLRAENDRDRRAAALRWLAVRRHRRAALPAEAVDYEDRNEFIEGTAKYIETALMAHLEGRAPDPSLWLAQGFRGFEDMGWFLEKRLESMRANMRGEVNVNNDPFGTSPVRGRLYFSGMGMALLLDRIAPGWKQRISTGNVSLTELAAEALDPTGEELAAALDEALSGPAHEELVREKTGLAEAGMRDTQEMLEEITGGPKTRLEIDYSALDTTQVGLSFTPFGVRGLDEDRTIYTLVPISAVTGTNDYGFDQTVPAPTLEDRAAQRFQCQLQDTVSSAALSGLLEPFRGAPCTVEGLDLELPGVAVRAPRARVSHTGEAVLVEFLPEEREGG